MEALKLIFVCVTLFNVQTTGNVVREAAAQLFPAMFVIGDSLLDPGNNVRLSFSLNSNRSFFVTNPDHPPYGRDLPSHRPSGRYSNGLVLSDILAGLMGLPYPPPYLSQKGNIVKGTSFASGGAVIFNTTRAVYQTPRDNFYDQVSFFKNVQGQLSTSLGEEYANDLISKSLFFVWMGANDYLIDYNGNPIGRSSSQKRYTTNQFRETLISLYRDYILDLYNMGARKFAMVSLPPIGCCPIARLFFSRMKNTKCVDFINKEAEDFNILLLNMSKQLQVAYPKAHFTFLNAYDRTMDAIQNPTAYGFIDGLQPCCSLGPYGGVPMCVTNISSICTDASKYLFWDFAHPTQRANFLIANWFLRGTPPDVQPMNLQQLAAL